MDLTHGTAMAWVLAGLRAQQQGDTGAEALRPRWLAAAAAAPARGWRACMPICCGAAERLTKAFDLMPAI